MKIRGFRIELGEIEATLRGIPAVREAVVAGARRPARRQATCRLCGERMTSAELGVTDIRAALERELPDYMVPSAIVALDRLPLTPNGKVDRKALPSPTPAVQKSADLRYEPPANELEAAVAEIWAQVLNRKRIGRRDDFFELGGHSLSAAMLASRIREVLKREISVATVFAAPTLGEFAESVASAPCQMPPEATLRSVGPRRGTADLRMDPHIISFNRNPVRRLDAPPTIFGVGNAKIVRPLAIRLEEAGQPFYVVRPTEAELPRGLGMPNARGSSAAFFLGLLRRAQPEGPYVLFGFARPPGSCSRWRVNWTRKPFS